MLNSVRRILENRANARAARIRDARLTVPRILPTVELPEPCYMHTTDADLESFLRRNQLTDALATYLRSQAERNLTAN